MDAIRLLIEAQSDQGIPCIAVESGKERFTLSTPQELEVFWESTDTLQAKFDWLEVPDTELQDLATKCFRAEGLNRCPDGKGLIALQMTCDALTAIWLLSIVLN